MDKLVEELFRKLEEDQVKIGMSCNFYHVIKMFC